LWLFFYLIILKNNFLWIFLNILLGLHLLVLLSHHLRLQLYRIIFDLLLYFHNLCLYLSCWVTRSQLSQRKTPFGALAGSLTSPGHLLRKNELSIEEIKMMQFSTKKIKTN
jgi:high-affinity Fe2+/Pb2+ permease